MPWAGNVKAILETYFAGESDGEAATKILFGLTNPSGYLAETFPIRLEDNPTYGNFGIMKRVEYKERLFVGYRYYDAKKMDVLFPFGHGLSYTTFEYKNILLNDSQKVVKFNEAKGEYDDVVISVYIDAVNTGGVVGKTVAQLYLELRPPLLNEKIHDWYVPAGNYKIIVGQSSRDQKSLSLDLVIQT